MRKFLAGLVIVGLASMAAADPSLSWDVSDLGSGLYGVLITVHGNDGLEASFFADMEFWGEQVDYVCLPGELQQLKAFGVVVVDDDVNADLYHNTVGSMYDMALDCYWYEPFPSNQAGGGIQEGPNMYRIEAGTGTLAYYEDMPLVYLCTTGDVGYDGYIARSGVAYDQSGIICVPEPATMLLLGIGAAGVMIRRKR